MVILGIDYGQKRTGLAVARERIAFEYRTLTTTDADSLVEEIGHICQKEKVEKVVIGLAKTATGELGFQAKREQEFGEKLKAKVDIPVVFQDEILSTREAERILVEQKIKGKKAVVQKDAKAAQLILQSYLDKKNK